MSARRLLVLSLLVTGLLALPVPVSAGPRTATGPLRRPRPVAQRHLQGHRPLGVAGPERRLRLRRVGTHIKDGVVWVTVNFEQTAPGWRERGGIL
jgi:hypothetical protein